MNVKKVNYRGDSKTILRLCDTINEIIDNGGGPPAVLSNLDITPMETVQNFTPPTGVTGYNVVNVAAIPPQYANIQGVTVGAGQVLSGYNFVDNSGATISGTMPNRGNVSNSLIAGNTYTIPAGYHAGGGTVTATLPSGYADVSGVTAQAGQVLSGYNFVDNNGAVTAGTMINRGAVTASIVAGGSYTIPAGYHNGSGTVSATLPANYANVAGVTASASEVLTGYSFVDNSGAVTAGTMINRGTITTSVVAGTRYYIPGGYHTGQGYVLATLPANYSNVAGVTASAAQVLSGYNIVTNTGATVQGTITNYGSVSTTIAPGGSATYGAGYYTGISVSASQPAGMTLSVTESSSKPITQRETAATTLTNNISITIGSSVTDISNLLCNWKYFNGDITIPYGVTRARNAFCNTAYNRNITLPNTLNNMYGMFSYTDFYANTSNLYINITCNTKPLNMAFMFSNSNLYKNQSKYNGVNLSMIRPFYLNNIAGMFYNCDQINNLEYLNYSLGSGGTKWYTDASILNADYYFYNSINLKPRSSDITSYFYPFPCEINYGLSGSTHAKLTARYAFAYCSNFNANRIIINNNVELTDASYMFQMASNLNATNIRFPPSVTNLQYCFQGCSKLSNVNIVVYNSAIDAIGMRNIIYQLNGINILCRNRAACNGTTAANSIRGTAITWTTYTNYIYNSLYNIRVYNNI